MKRTYQPKKLKARRKHGYLKRSSTAKGKLVLKRRRAKGRQQLTVADYQRKLLKSPRKSLR